MVDGAWLEYILEIREIAVGYWDVWRLSEFDEMGVMRLENGNLVILEGTVVDLDRTGWWGDL